MSVIVPVEAPWKDQWRAALADFHATWSDRRIWIMSSIVSVGNRYRRTILGPWWLTLSTLMFVFGLAVLRIGLNGGDLRTAIPYVGLGFIIFQLISSGVSAGAGVFANSGSQLSTSRLSYSSYVMRADSTAFIDFLHDVIVVLLIALIFAIPLTLLWSQAVLAVVLILISSVGIGLWLGPLVCRFRDVGPFVSAVMRLMFFLTPIFWSIDQLEATGRAWLAWFNPFTYQLLAFRDPILGTTHPGAPISPLLMSAIIAGVNLVLGIFVFASTRTRIPYWASE